MLSHHCSFCLACACHQHASSQLTEEHGHPSEGGQGTGAVYLLLFFSLEMHFILSGYLLLQQSFAIK